MMRHFIGCLLAALGLFAAASHAQEEAPNPVVVELFTSQGCSVCPPADAFLHELAQRDDVIALSLHVDYWDYIGWKDSFAHPAFTARQKAYARAGSRKSIYTPQIIVGGTDAMVGHDAMKIVMAIEAHKRVPRLVEIRVTHREDGRVRVRLEPRTENAPAGVMQLVRYTPQADVFIRSGENAGRKARYANVVRDWTQIGTWEGEAVEISVDVPGPEPAVLIVQRAGHREVLASAWLK